MTSFTAVPGPGTLANDLEKTPAKHHPYRWRLNRGGIVNVWFYFDSEFSIAGGRIIWRGTNGAGKSRALEMLLPFLIDADRRKMDATGAGKVRLEDLMKAGGDEQPNRLGYLWVELVRAHENGESEYLTLGALVRFSRSTAEAKAWYFTTPLRVGVDLVLLDQQRVPLAREKLAELIGSDRITDSPEAHRERVRSTVFMLTGESGRERYAGLLQLLHTLRSPDVGNRIEEGKLPAIVSEALPPLSETALNSAGEYSSMRCPRPAPRSGGSMRPAPMSSSSSMFTAVTQQAFLPAPRTRHVPPRPPAARPRRRPRPQCDGMTPLPPSCPAPRRGAPSLMRPKASWQRRSPA